MKKEIECPFCGTMLDLVAETSKYLHYKCRKCGKFTKAEFSANARTPNFDFSPSDYKSDDSSTQKKARLLAEASGLAESQRQIVFNAIKEHKNLAICEISEITGIQKSSICPRLSELRKENKIVKIGCKKIFDEALNSFKEVEVWGMGAEGKCQDNKK